MIAHFLAMNLFLSAERAPSAGASAFVEVVRIGEHGKARGARQQVMKQPELSP
jgi:hypothetical protein